MTDLKKMAVEEMKRIGMFAGTFSFDIGVDIYLAGARAGIEAAAKLAYHGVESSAGSHHSSRTIASAIRSLLPEVST